ncbi:hypothetical protein CFIMG_000573RAa [Ceratocystis fimbriata CBS 114723]|uniref:Uncharacterized protein n=1 Tax=Ceratocystis fimbriata CBS 114723 TaxID=1035309 RepID=A0A2C5X314_9PEZI|nr:hypothetical protein CFIMG_000573RAa [Ceratocystis fimbriata CBS 114723]
MSQPATVIVAKMRKTKQIKLPRYTAQVYGISTRHSSLTSRLALIVPRNGCTPSIKDGHGCGRRLTEHILLDQ